MTDIEDVEAAADDTVDNGEEGAFNDAFDDSGLLSPEEKSDSEDEYFAPGHKRPKASKKLKKAQADAEYEEVEDAAGKKRKVKKAPVWTLEAPFESVHCYLQRSAI